MKKNFNHLKLIVAVCFLTISNGFSQSKNERIEILQQQVDSLLVVNKKLYEEFESEKQNNAQLIELNSQLSKSCKNLDSLLKISNGIINFSKSQYKVLSDELKETENSTEVIEKILQLQHNNSYTKTIFSHNGREFFKEEKPEWEFDRIEYTFYFNSDNVLYKIELSPIPIRYTLFSTIYFDFYGNTISMKHSTNEAARDENSTTIYTDEYKYFFNPNLHFEELQHFIKSNEYCFGDEHNHEMEYSCDKTEISIRNRMYTNRAILLGLIEQAK